MKVKEMADKFVTMTVQDVMAGVGPGIFTVVFTKKDGTLRTMNARRGVSVGVKGTGKPKTNDNNITVFDVKLDQNGELKEGVLTKLAPEKCYRSFNADTVREIRAGGYKFVCMNGYVVSVTR